MVHVDGCYKHLCQWQGRKVLLSIFVDGKVPGRKMDGDRWRDTFTARLTPGYPPSDGQGRYGLPFEHVDAG
jgi:hypothetical protein